MKRSHQVKEGRVSEVRFSWGYQATDRESVDCVDGVYGMGDRAIRSRSHSVIVC